jgi:5'-methylthioadenosine phosphorylase
MSLSGIPTEFVHERPRLAIIGGSGMCSFPELTEVYRVRPMTRYGMPSDDIKVCCYAGQMIAFLPRHGEQHSIAPHKVPYKANLAALRDLGVETVVATCIAGSLKEAIPPGSFVIPDQFVNLTWGRDDYVDPDGGLFIHLPMAEPYCALTRTSITSAVRVLGFTAVEQGTVAVVQGPRFSTKAESQMYMRNGWDIVNMTQYPECYLARELGLCYGVLAVVTDYDVGVTSCLSMDPKHMHDVLNIFRDGVEKTKQILLQFIEGYKLTPIHCGCSQAIVTTYYEYE